MTELHLILSSKLASTSVYLTTFIREDSDGFIHVYFSCFPRFVSLPALLEGVSVVRDDVDCCCGWKWLGYMRAWHIYCRTRLDLRIQKVWQQKTVYEATEYTVKFDTLEYVIINNGETNLDDPLGVFSMGMRSLSTQRSSLTSLTRSPSTFATMRRISMILGVSSSIKSSAIQKGPLTT